MLIIALPVEMEIALLTLFIPASVGILKDSNATGKSYFSESGLSLV